MTDHRQMLITAKNANFPKNCDIPFELCRPSLLLVENPLCYGASLPCYLSCCCAICSNF